MSYAPIPAEPTADADALNRTTISSSFSKQTLSNRARLRRRKGELRAVHHRAEARDGEANEAGQNYPLIVHSHLCWDWVWQRPQQFMSRLSHTHKVLFVETLAPDPTLAAPLVRFRQAAGLPNLTLLTLQFPAWRWQDGDYVDGERRRLVQEFVHGPAAGLFEHPVQWFYDPMAFPAFAGQMGEILTVYDCMDELSQFNGAPPELVARERALLAKAEVVFTGGRKLFEAKSQLHDNCHFYGCGVDCQHFGQGRQEETEVPASVRELPHPVLGYFGVIDERLDYELIGKLAEANRQGSVVMVGPVTKVGKESLPQRGNLHWLGQQPYAQLPALCKGFDVCLMPFALNRATEYINPTKALEYMATGKPIVSTAVADVVRNFGSVIKIASTHEEFVRHCRRCHEQPDYAAISRGLTMSSEHSWESIVSRLEGHIREALERKSVNVPRQACTGASAHLAA